MKNRRNYYRILHVQPDAHREIIKASYRTLMQKLKLHPDLGGDEWNASILNEAYSTLSDNKKRTEYDKQFLHKMRKNQRPDNRKQQPKDTGKDCHEKKTSEYWKDQSVCPFCGTPKPARSHYNGNSIDCSHCSSPLRTVVRLDITGKSQRKLQRISQNAPIRIYTHPAEAAAKPGVIRDLSPQGMQCTLNDKLDNGQVIRIVSNLLSATARVSYCKQKGDTGQYVIGVQFLTLHINNQVGTFFTGSA